jgi:hypothetical protein
MATAKAGKAKSLKPLVDVKDTVARSKKTREETAAKGRKALAGETKGKAKEEAAPKKPAKK